MKKASAGSIQDPSDPFSIYSNGDARGKAKGAANAESWSKGGRLSSIRTDSTTLSPPDVRGYLVSQSSTSRGSSNEFSAELKRKKSLDEDYVDTLSDAYLEILKSKLPEKIVLIAKKKGKSLVMRKLYDAEKEKVENVLIEGSAHAQARVDPTDMVRSCEGCVCGCRGSPKERETVTSGNGLRGKLARLRKILITLIKISEREKTVIPPSSDDKKWETLYIDRLRNYVNEQISRMNGLNKTSMEGRLYNETGWLPRKDEIKNSILNNLNLYDLYLASKKPLFSYEEELKRAQKEEEEFLLTVENEVQKVREYLVYCMSEKSAAAISRMIEFEETKYKDRLKRSIENMAVESKEAIKKAKLCVRIAVANEQSLKYEKAKKEISETFNQRLTAFNQFATEAFQFENQWKSVEKDEDFRIKILLFGCLLGVTRKFTEKCNKINEQLTNVGCILRADGQDQVKDQEELIEKLNEAYDAAVKMFSDSRINRQVNLAKALHERSKEIVELTSHTAELEKMNENWKLIVERLINQFQKLINFVTKEKPVQNAYLLSLDRLFKLHLEDFIKVCREKLTTRERFRRYKILLKTIKKESSSESQPSSNITKSTSEDEFDSNLGKALQTSYAKYRTPKEKSSDESTGSVEMKNLLREAIQVVGVTDLKTKKPEKGESELGCESNNAEERLVALLKSVSNIPEAKKLFLNY